MPDSTFTLSVLPTETTTVTITDTVHHDSAESPIVDDQGEDGNTPRERDRTPGDTVASVSPRGESANPSHEVDATTVNAQNVESTDEPVPSSDELLSEVSTEVIVPDHDMHHDWAADDGETTTTVVLPDPPSTDPTLSPSRSETIVPEPDTKPSHFKATPGTLYIALLSPVEAHDQRISYLVGDVPKVAVMVPHAGPQTTNQEAEIQEEKEAKQAAEKIEAERDELEKSHANRVEPKTVEETAPVGFKDESALPVESVTQGQW